MFNTTYFPQLYLSIKREIPSVNGTLTNANVSFSDNTLTIELQNGGKSLLDAKGFDKALVNLIAEEFDLHLSINYTGTLEVNADSDEYKEVIKSAEQQMQREQLAKAADFYKEEEETSKKVQKQHSENVTEEVEIREGKFASPQLIQSSVRPLYGSSIRGKMVPISSIAEDSGRVVVWGDVFDIDKRVTKSGDKNIFNFDITDYTGSTTVKIFNSIKDCAPLDTLKKGSTIVAMGDIEYDKYAGEIVLNARSIGTAKKVQVCDKAEKSVLNFICIQICLRWTLLLLPVNL